MKHRAWALLAVGIVAGILLFGVSIDASWLPVCVLYETSGVHCPGCGLTRATKSALTGDFIRAFQLNPVALTLSPFLITWVFMEVRHWLLGRKGNAVKFRVLHIKIIFVFVISWFVARNIPMTMFEWARPTPDTIFGPERE